MPAHRVPDAVKKKRGTYRPDRAEDAPAGSDRPEAVKEYLIAAHTAYAHAAKGGDVSQRIAYLREAEHALALHGITDETGRPWRMSKLVELAAHGARQH